MLAKGNRVRSGGDFKTTVRRGKRLSSPHAVFYVVGGSSARPTVTDSDEAKPTRFGFIVSKAVGNSVARNRVRRRLRSIAAEVLPHANRGSTVVVRMLPGSAQLPWTTLRSEVSVSLRRAVEGL